MSPTSSEFDVDGAKLAAKTWTAANEQGTVLVLHGFADRAIAFTELGEYLSENGYTAIAYDARGAGESVKNKKDLNVTNEHYVFADLNAVLKQVLSQAKGPVYLLGHSMGGGIVLNYGVKGDHREKLSGIIALGPLIETHPNQTPNRFLRGVLPWIAKMFPKLKQGTSVNVSDVSQRQDIVDAIKADPLRKDTATVEMIYDFLTRGKRLTSSVFVGKFANVPLLVCHGASDRICDINGSRKFYKLLKIEDKTMLEYEGAYHELHNEIPEHQTKFFADLLTWLSKHTTNNNVAKSAAETLPTSAAPAPVEETDQSTDQEPAAAAATAPVVVSAPVAVTPATLAAPIEPSGSEVENASTRAIASVAGVEASSKKIESESTSKPQAAVDAVSPPVETKEEPVKTETVEQPAKEDAVEPVTTLADEPTAIPKSIDEPFETKVDTAAVPAAAPEPVVPEPVAAAVPVEEVPPVAPKKDDELKPTEQQPAKEAVAPIIEAASEPAKDEPVVEAVKPVEAPAVPEDVNAPVVAESAAEPAEAADAVTDLPEDNENKDDEKESSEDDKNVSVKPSTDSLKGNANAGGSTKSKNKKKKSKKKGKK